MKPFTYKGYVGAPTVDADAGVIRGVVINTRDTITFQGQTVREAEHEFRESVDDYLDFCAERGVEPEKPFSGKFPVRTSSRLHRDLAVAAGRRGMSLNAFVESVLIEATRGEREARPEGAAGKQDPSGQASVRRKAAAARTARMKARAKKAAKKRASA